MSTFHPIQNHEDVKMLAGPGELNTAYLAIGNVEIGPQSRENLGGTQSRHPGLEHSAPGLSV